MRLSFRTLQRRNALRGAPRHKSAPRHGPEIGRRASRTACDAERRTIVENPPATRRMRIQTASQFFTPPRNPSATLSALLLCDPCTVRSGWHTFGAASDRAGNADVVGA
ncbi:DUF1534 domain-containing protein [Pseudomonas cannabina]|nr:DUF1534 domain-containing protein [Pseudomonas cannabina]